MSTHLMDIRWPLHVQRKRQQRVLDGVSKQRMELVTRMEKNLELRRADLVSQIRSVAMDGAVADGESCTNVCCAVVVRFSWLQLHCTC